MAVATYNTDLTPLTNAESGTWGEFVGYASGGSPSTDIEYYIEGSGCVTQSFGTKTGAIFSIVYDAGSDISASFTTGICLFIWQVCIAGNAMDSYVNGGLRVGIGADLTDFDMWISGGNDYGKNPYGSWHNIAIDPTVSADYTGGAGNGGAYRWFGSALNLSNAVSKGNPHGVDRLAYGRGELYIEFGESGAYGTFLAMATANDGQTARWGLFQAEGTGYLWKGLISLGTATNAVDFRDLNRNITIDDTPKTYVAFNRIEINHASSNVEWERINITALDGTGLSVGEFEMVDNATVLFDFCVFTDMSTFVFLSNAVINACVFLRCGQITHGGADFDICSFVGYEGTAGTAYLTYNIATDPDGEVDGCTFTKGTAATHAIEFGTLTPTTITLRDIDFSGYNASNEQDDSTLRFLHTTGTITVNLIGCTGNISYKKEAGAIVNLVINPVTLTVRVKDSSTGLAIQNARALVYVDDGANFPYQESVTITGSGTTATVTHTTHGLETGDDILIQGADQEYYNGAYSITVTGVDTYTYTAAETLVVSPATGTIVATMTLINELTDIDGIASDSRTYTADQIIVGRVRKSTVSPLYVQGTIADTIDKDTGKELSIQLVSDE